MTKTCPNCKRVLPVSEFATDLTRPDGLTYECKHCRAQRQHIRDIANRDAKRERNARDYADRRFQQYVDDFKDSHSWLLEDEDDEGCSRPTIYTSDPWTRLMNELTDSEVVLLNAVTGTITPAEARYYLGLTRSIYVDAINNLRTKCQDILGVK